MLSMFSELVSYNFMILESLVHSVFGRGVYTDRIFLSPKEHERNREENFDSLDIYNHTESTLDSRSVTPYGAISGGGTGGITAQNLTDGTFTTHKIITELIITCTPI